MVAKANSQPLVSIVILNWNGLEDTKLCLEHVRNLDYSNYEIIVVDNGSSQDQKDYLANLNDIVFIDNPTNRGFAGGQADGYKQAKGDFILLLNNDAVIDKNYLKNALPMFDDPKVAAVGGRSYFWNENEDIFDTKNHFYSYMDVHPITAETTLQTSDFGSIQEVNTISGAAALIRKSVVDQVGYLWEPFFAYYEETDLFARIKRAGYKVLYNPKLHIWHKNGASSDSQGGSYFFYYHIFRNRYMYAIRNFDDNYFKLFKKSYYRQALVSVKNIFAGANHRRLAHAYIDSIIYILRKKRSLSISRKSLKKILPDVSYNKQLIKERLKVSVVIDALSLTSKQLTDAIKKVSFDDNPLHEYIFVTKKQFDTKHTNIRLVTDRGYFDNHPINLGCLAARYDWMVISSYNDLEPIDNYITPIASIDDSILAIESDNNRSIMIHKDLFNLMGGLHQNNSSLGENISYVRNYAYLKNVLKFNTPPNIIPKDKALTLSYIDMDKHLFSAQKHHKLDNFFAHHYHLQQIRNVFRWFLVSSISLRRKAGRAKNLLLFSLSLNRKRLATEFRYIREELYAESLQKNTNNLYHIIKNKSDSFVKQQLKSVSNIPVFIICYERVNDLRNLVAKLNKMGLKKIVLIDNDSTYPPLLDYYNSSPYQVLRLGRNIGHTSPWSLGIIRNLIPHGYYIVTDPDVIPTDKCLDSSPIEHLLRIHKKYSSYQKVGFGLKIDDLPDHYPLKNDVITWEKQFWKTELEDNIFEAGVDTTFALYKPETYLYMLHPSLRTGEPYTARHMPWYGDPNKQSEEDLYYKMRANSNITSWNVDELPERYAKEMNR